MSERPQRIGYLAFVMGEPAVWLESEGRLCVCANQRDVSANAAGGMGATVFPDVPAMRRAVNATIEFFVARPLDQGNQILRTIRGYTFLPVHVAAEGRAHE